MINTNEMYKNYLAAIKYHSVALSILRESRSCSSCTVRGTFVMICLKLLVIELFSSS